MATGARGANKPPPKPNDLNVNSAESAKLELEKLVSIAVKEYEDDFQLKTQIKEAEAAGEDFKKFRSKRRTANPVSEMEDGEGIKTAQMVRQIYKECKHPDHGEIIQNTLKSMSGNFEGKRDLRSVKQMFGPPASTKEKDQEGGDMNFVIAKQLQSMSQIPKDMPGVEVGAMEQTGEDIMTTMMAEFERFGEKKDYMSFIENNLRQLLSKHIMFDPIKKICDKFPEWLSIQEGSLSKEEYTRFGRQYQQFQKMVTTYETEPDNFPRLMEILYDLQEFGQTPADIIRELAPGLQFNEEGLPVMPEVGGNTMPHMPNVPFPQQEACSQS